MNRSALRLAAFGAALAGVALCALPGAAGAWVIHESGRGASMQHPSAWIAPAGGDQCLTAGTDTGQRPVPGCDLPLPDANGTGVIRLGTSDSNTVWHSGAIVTKAPIPVSAGAIITFTGAQYGAPVGRHGDGFGVNIIDGDLPVDWSQSFSGNTSAYLGYAPRMNVDYNGFVDGLFSVGYDAFGEYQRPLDPFGDCHDPAHVGPWPFDTITVRGPGTGYEGYCEDAQDMTASPMTGTTRADSRHTYQVIIPPQPAISSTNVIVKMDGVVKLSVPLADLVSSGYTGPSIGSVHSFRVMIASNTGNNYDTHEIWNVSVRPAAALQLTQKTREPTFSHVGEVTHYRFLLTNIGTMPLNRLDVDYHRGGSFNKHDLVCPAIWLQPGQTVACTAWHRVTAHEMHGRRVRDTMYAWGYTDSHRQVYAPSHGGTMPYKASPSSPHSGKGSGHQI